MTNKKLPYWAFLIALLFSGCETTTQENPEPSSTLKLEEFEFTPDSAPPPSIEGEEIRESEAPQGIQTQSIAEKKNRIGILLPLSGKRAPVGKTFKNTAEMSFFDNANDHLELIFKDTEGTPAGAKKAAYDLIRTDVDLILGPIFSDEAQEVSPLTQQKGIPLLSFSNDTKLAQPHVYPLGFSLQDQVVRVVTYGAKQGQKTVHALMPNNKSSSLILEALNRLEHQGILSSLKVIDYNANGEDLGAKLDSIPWSEVENLLVVEGEGILRQVLSHLQQEPKSSLNILGTECWEKIERIPLLSHTKLYFSASDLNARKSFQKNYQTLYHHKAERLSTLMYDALAMVASLTKMRPQKDSFYAGLTHAAGFDGVDGIFRLKENGTVERAYGIYTLTGQGSELIEAPTFLKTE